MATQPTFPNGTESTGTAWKTRSGALVHKIRKESAHQSVGWFCTGCLAVSEPSTYYTDRTAAEAQTHADGCTGIQV
jgi:hypothetical protein